MTIDTLANVCKVLHHQGNDSGDEVLNKRISLRLPKYLKKLISMTDRSLKRVDDGEEELSE